ncbi:MAG: BMP family ABC transporter substrate-binding protein [Clostridia bacterium]|nr:BMP family ABC transporter substrate-binding protein [Clostridia bacterium]
MKKISRIIALLCAMVFVLAGCKKPSGNVTTLENPESAKMYALILSDAQMNDNGMNQYTWQGIMNLKDSINVQTKYYEAKDLSEIESNIDSAILSKYDIIFSLGDMANQTLQKKKTSSLETLFAYINTENDTILDANSFSIEFADYEGAFVAGYLACETTKTGTISFLGDVQNTSCDNVKYGFYAGAHYYNVVNKKDIKLTNKLAETKTDVAKIKSTLESLYKEGADVVFVNFDFAQEEMLEVASSENGKLIGTGYVDDTKTHARLIAKSIKHIGEGIKNISDLYIKNENLGGKAYVYGMKEGCISFNYDKGQIPLEVIDKVDIVKQKIANGEIDVPVGYEEYQNYIEGSKDATPEETPESTKESTKE